MNTGDGIRSRPLRYCPCGNASFLVITEKLYAAAVDAEGILACQDQSEFIKRIICSRCGQEFDEKDFKGIDF